MTIDIPHLRRLMEEESDAMAAYRATYATLCSARDLSHEPEGYAAMRKAGDVSDHALAKHFAVREALKDAALEALPELLDIAEKVPASAVPEVSEAMLSAAMASGPIPGYCNLGHLLKKVGIADGQDWVRAALVAALGVSKS